MGSVPIFLSLDQPRQTHFERLVVASMQAQERADRAEAVRADAEAANRMKDEFLAIVSHELRTPLTAILGWTGIVRSRPLDSTRTDGALAVVERNARALAQTESLDGHPGIGARMSQPAFGI